MNSNLRLLLSQAEIDSRLREAQSRQRTAAGGREADAPVVVRLARDADGPVLERLTQLEGRELPAGTTLLAERRGEVLAAVALAGGEPIADPFRPTADLVVLLLASRTALQGERGRGNRRRRLAFVARLLGRRPRAAPTVPGSEYLLTR
jgi:hypothetical protein